MAKSKPVTEALENTLPSAAKAEDPVDNYQVQDHLRTLTDAHKIINDPEKMAKVHKLAGRHAKALAGIKSIPMPDDSPDVKSTDDMRSYANKKFGPKKSNSLNSMKASDQDGE